ncbi:CvpA family protein [Thermovibrio sp.]
MLSSLNLLDALILITLGWNLIRGFNKGFVEEVISILGIVFSIYVAYFYAPKLSYLLLKSSSPAVIVLTGFFTFLLLFSVSKLISSFIDSKVSKTSLGFLNNLLGTLFGILRGVLISSLLVFSISVLFPKSYLVKKSSLGALFVPVINYSFSLLDGDVEKSWKEKWKLAEPVLVKNWEKFKGELLRRGGARG